MFLAERETGNPESVFSKESTNSQTPLPEIVSCEPSADGWIDPRLHAQRAQERTGTSPDDSDLLNIFVLRSLRDNLSPSKETWSSHSESEKISTYLNGEICKQ
jgi:hypothetical protein